MEAQRWQGQGTVTATHSSDKCLSCPVCYSCCRGVKPPSPLGDQAAPGHLQRPHQDWNQWTDVTALTSHRISPWGVRARAVLCSQQGGASRETSSSSITLATSVLPHALASVSKDARWHKEINTLHCQKSTKQRLLQLHKWQACDTAAPAKGKDSPHGKRPLAGSVEYSLSATGLSSKPVPLQKAATGLLLPCHYCISQSLSAILPPGTGGPKFKPEDPAIGSPAQLQPLQQVHMSTRLFPHISCRRRDIVKVVY